MWTLIILVIVGPYPSQVVLPGFASQDACAAFGKAWGDQLTGPSEDPNRAISYRARCVKVV